MKYQSEQGKVHDSFQTPVCFQILQCLGVPIETACLFSWKTLLPAPSTARELTKNR